MIPRGAKAQFDGAAVEALVETLGIEIAGAFIEQIGDQIADAGLVGGVLGPPFGDLFLRGGGAWWGGGGARGARPSSNVLDPGAGGGPPAIPARQRRLIVLGVDRFGDQLGLDPFEILWESELLSDIRYH